MKASVKRKIRAFFSDKQGNVVIAQAANPPLLAWYGFMAGWLLTLFVFKEIHIIFRIGAYVSILYWATLEILSGVCLWRKTLGLTVYTIAIIMIVLNV
jgi:hypothetical protein